MDNGLTEETPRLERKLATILSADVAEYSRLMAENEEQTLRTFQSYRKIFESLVPLHRGRIFNTAGDAILAEFQSAVEAVRCATEIQSALRTCNDQLAPNRQVRFRIGINLGDVLLHDQDLLGDGVNVAARLQSAAQPGGVCISGSVYDQIQNKLSLTFKPLGDLNFKNLPQSVRTFFLADVTTGELSQPPNAAGGKRSSRQVLPRVLAVSFLLMALAVGLLAIRRDPGSQPIIEVVGNRTVAMFSQSGKSKASKELSADVFDGTYSGPICYGPGANDQARCFLGQAVISHGKISSQWSGRDNAAATILSGNVSAVGEVHLEIHGEAADKVRIFTVDLTGELRNGQLDASGFFRNGRIASINWHKN